MNNNLNNVEEEVQDWSNRMLEGTEQSHSALEVSGSVEGPNY